jgi:curli biogenesis system outer membrane secretion channel CsgG
MRIENNFPWYSNITTSSKKNKNMKPLIKKTISLFFITVSLICLNTFCYSQDADVKSDKNKDKVTIETIKPVCPDLAQDKKPRLTVANFKLTAPNAPRDQFGDNLATMLTNALQHVQCYRVLERLANMGDVQDELKFQNSGDVNKKTAVAKGNMMGANVIVQGEVTEFEQSANGMGVGIVKKKSYHAKVGIIIRMIDPETREVLAIESFNVEKKIGGGFQVGVTLPGNIPVNAMSTAFSNPAVQDATEDCIIKATQYIASQKDKVKLPENSVPDGASQYTLTVKNIDYSKLSTVASAIEKIPGVNNVNSDDFNENTANIIVTQTIKLKELIDKVMAANTGVKLSVTGMSKDGATLTVK